MVIHALGLLRSSAIISRRRFTPNKGMKYRPKKSGNEKSDGFMYTDAYERNIAAAATIRIALKVIPNNSGERFLPQLLLPVPFLFILFY